MALSISMVTNTDRAIVMGWGSLKTRQSTPLNSSPSPMQARWWVCNIKYHKYTKLQRIMNICMSLLWSFGVSGLYMDDEQIHIWGVRCTYCGDQCRSKGRASQAAAQCANPYRVLKHHWNKLEICWTVDMHLPRGTEETHDKPQSGYPVSRPRFEPGTSLIRSRSWNVKHI
jgi:hypothetical protein